MGRFVFGLAGLVALGCVDLTPPYEQSPDAGGSGGSGGGGISRDAAAGGAMAACPVNAAEGKLWDFELGLDLFPNGARGMSFGSVNPSAGSQTTQAIADDQVLCGQAALRYSGSLAAESGVRGVLAPQTGGQPQNLDASGYRGVQFVYRSEGTPVTFRVTTATGRYKFALDGARAWHTQLVPFAMMMREPSPEAPNPPATIDKARMRTFEWAVPTGARVIDLDQIWFFK